MKRHFKINMEMIIVAFETLMIGILVFAKQTQLLHHHLPPAIAWTDSNVTGILFIVLGVLLFVNAIWDFYWYYARAILLMASAFMWSCLTISYFLDRLQGGYISIAPILFAVIVLRILLIAKNQPSYKIRSWKGGKHG